MNIEELEAKLNRINNLAVSYHEEGPFDAGESLRRVMEIYDISLLEETK